MKNRDRCPVCNSEFSPHAESCSGCGWERGAERGSGHRTWLVTLVALALVGGSVGGLYTFFRQRASGEAGVDASRGLRARLPFLTAEEAAQENAKAFAGYTDEEIKRASGRCEGDDVLACQIKHWFEIHRRNPNDPGVKANLGMRLAEAGLHDVAIPYLKASIELGSGGYDTFAWYARALRRAGNLDESISWAYRTLDMAPNLMDVTSELAEMLVQRKRAWEALGLLAGFQSKYGDGQKVFQSRIVGISSGLPKPAGSPLPGQEVRIPEVAGHFYIPITLPGGRNPGIFLVDTGATLTLIPRVLWEESGQTAKPAGSGQAFRLADGRTVRYDVFAFESWDVAGSALKDVRVGVGQEASALLGQNVLSHFDMRTEAVQGRRFLVLRPSGQGH